MAKNTTQNDALRLSELLEQNAIGRQEYHEIMSNAGYRSPNTRNSFLDRREKPEIPKSDLCLICSLFGLRPEEFGYPSDYFTSRYSKAEAQVYCYNDYREGESNNRSFTENFFHEVNKHLLRVEHELLICDYLDKVRGIGQKENMDYYHARDTEYYHALETRLAEKIKEQKPVSYKRIIQVPLGVQVPDFESAVKFVLEEMFAESFEHFCKCLRDFRKHCEFVVVQRPFRLHTFYLVDAEVVLTEYHRYDRFGIPMPDTLFVNVRNPSDPNAVGSIYTRACLKEFRRLLNSPSNKGCKLTKYIIINSVLEMEQQIGEEMTTLAARLDAEDAMIQSEIGGKQLRLDLEEGIQLTPEAKRILNQWDQDEKRLDTLRERYENVLEKRKILREVFHS